MPPVRYSSTRLMGWFQGQEYEAIADPPETFRVLAMTRAARYAVERLRRRTSYGLWRGEVVTVLQAEAEWCRLRLVNPTPATSISPTAVLQAAKKCGTLPRSAPARIRTKNCGLADRRFIR